jgi:dienelactone hydrolase
MKRTTDNRPVTHDEDHPIPVESMDSNASRREFLRGSTVTAIGIAGLRAKSSLAVEPTDRPREENNCPVSANNAEKDHTMPHPFRKQLLRCLGGPWPETHDLKPRVEKTEDREGYVIEWLSYEAETDDRIPAILLRPRGRSAQSPGPAIAIWHQHAGQWHLGKSEPAGLAGSSMHHTGVELAKLGYTVLCPDALCFEERQDPTGKLKGGGYERFEFLRYVVDGKCMAWKNILDMQRAIDYLVTRDEVDTNRIGCYGHSMGSTHTWLVGPWEPRLKCLVGNCCLPTYAAIRRTKLLHCFPNFVPGLHEFGDTPDIAALIAPRGLHFNFGENDGGSPIKEVREGVKRIAEAYQMRGAAEQFSYFIEPDTGHVLSAAMWDKTKEFFAKHLGS